MADIIVHAGIDDQLTPGLAKIGNEAKNTQAKVEDMGTSSVRQFGHMGHGLETITNTFEGGQPSIRGFFMALTTGMESAEAGTMAMTLGMGALVLGVVEGISKIQEYFATQSEEEKKSAEVSIKWQEDMNAAIIENLRLRGKEVEASDKETHDAELKELQQYQNRSIELHKKYKDDINLANTGDNLSNPEKAVKALFLGLSPEEYSAHQKELSDVDKQYTDLKAKLDDNAKMTHDRVVKDETDKKNEELKKQEKDYLDYVNKLSKIDADTTAARTRTEKVKEKSEEDAIALGNKRYMEHFNADQKQIVEDEKVDKMEQEGAERAARHIIDLENAKTQAISDGIMGLSELMATVGAKSKAAMEVSKTLAVADVTIKTIQAEEKAYADPLLPFPLNLIEGAGMAAAGLANIAKIEGVTFQTSPGYDKSITLPGNPNQQVSVTGHGGERLKFGRGDDGGGTVVNLHFYPGAKVDSRTVSDLESMARNGHFNKAYNLQKAIGGRS